MKLLLASYLRILWSKRLCSCSLCFFTATPFHISSPPPLYNFHVFLPTKLVSVVIYFLLLTSVTLDIGLHVEGVRTIGVRTLRHNQIFLDGKFAKFSYPWCSAGALSVQELHALLFSECVYDKKSTV